MSSPNDEGLLKVVEAVSDLQRWVPGLDLHEINNDHEGNTVIHYESSLRLK